MMAQKRRGSTASSATEVPDDQELGSMYDYLAKIILLGPSGTGKSCLLHRFVKNEWRVLSSQTIGVEFASKIIKVGTGIGRKRIKLQLWDTAGTERFRSVSRSYYRGAAGAILVYDIASHKSFEGLTTFLTDARALASPNLTLLLVGNKADLASGAPPADGSLPDRSPALGTIPSSYPSRQSTSAGGASTRSSTYGIGSQLTATTTSEGREVFPEEVSRWASSQNIPVSVEVSAYSGDGVDEVFARLARMILTKIELGEIDPDDPQSGIQYGDSGAWGISDGGSVKSGMTTGIGDTGLRQRRKRGATNGWMNGMREWEAVFTLDGTQRRRRRGGCC